MCTDKSFLLLLPLVHTKERGDLGILEPRACIEFEASKGYTSTFHNHALNEEDIAKCKSLASCHDLTLIHETIPSLLFHLVIH